MRSILLGFAAVATLAGSPFAGAAEPARRPRGADSFQQLVEDRSLPLPPIRAITRGPKFHWFGYYDKFQFDPSDRYVLAMQVDFEHRMPAPGEAIRIGMIDLAEGDRWIELGTSRAWCWQQGCMLQWRPGSDSEVLWNDREGERFVTRILDVKTGEKRTVPMAVNHVAPGGTWAVTTDFRRIFDIRPSYGYAGLADPFANDPAPEQSGVWLVNLDSGHTELVISLAELAAIEYRGAKDDDKHRVYHCMWNTDGSRFLFYNRWAGGTRVFTAAADGTDLRLLSASGASHYTWRDPQHAVIWAGAYRLYQDDGSGEPKETILEAPNGHQTFVPDTNNEWMLTDTYPQKDNREQIVYLFHVPTGKLYLLGRFHSPREYGGFWRVDAHPRISRDGTQVVIDATHGGEGRQQYLIEIGHIIRGAEAEAQAGPPYIDPDQAPAD